MAQDTDTPLMLESLDGVNKSEEEISEDVESCIEESHALVNDTGAEIFFGLSSKLTVRHDGEDYSLISILIGNDSIIRAVIKSKDSSSVIKVLYSDIEMDRACKRMMDNYIAEVSLQAIAHKETTNDMYIGKDISVAVKNMAVSSEDVLTDLCSYSKIRKGITYNSRSISLKGYSYGRHKRI